ncbi:MAG TPA: hypothetical protein VFY45_13295 [Baekduia sp.]|nr:hypothetical protein [Baekduia sp.]
MPRLTTPLSVLAVAGASIALAACGSSSGGDSTNSAGASAGQGQGANQSAAFKKFQDCLKDNGVTLPDRGRQSGGGQGNGYGPPAGGDGTPPTGTNGAPPAGGAPGGGFADNPKFQAAMKACAKLRPQGLGNGRGGPGGTGPQQSIKAFTPYLTCLKDQGLDIKVSDGFNALRNLKRDDTKVQAALKACQSKIPQRPTAPQGTSTTT